MVKSQPKGLSKGMSRGKPIIDPEGNVIGIKKVVFLTRREFAVLYPNHQPPPLDMATVEGWADKAKELNIDYNVPRGGRI